MSCHVLFNFWPVDLVLKFHFGIAKHSFIFCSWLPAKLGFYQRRRQATTRRLEASVRRAIRLGLYTSDDPSSQLNWLSTWTTNFSQTHWTRTILATFCTNFFRAKRVILQSQTSSSLRVTNCQTDCNTFIIYMYRMGQVRWKLRGVSSPTSSQNVMNSGPQTA